MASCSWKITTNIRTIDLAGEGTPGVFGSNARCQNLGFQRQIRLSGEIEGFCAFANEQIVSSTRDCGPLDPDKPHDCLNGGCIPKATYNTPGKYASLAACQAGCAKDSNCSGECVSAAEIAALQQAANLVRNKLCG